MDIRRTRGSTFSLEYHLVFPVKWNQEILDDRSLEALGVQFESICNATSCDLIDFRGAEYYVEFLVNLPPTQSISMLVNALKGASCRKLLRDRPDIALKLEDENTLWAANYFAVSVNDATFDNVSVAEAVYDYLESTSGR